MAVFGPILLITESPAAEINAFLDAAGATPIVEVGWAKAAAAVAKVKPAAGIIADAADQAATAALADRLADADTLIPLFARVAGGTLAPAQALPITPDVSPGRFAARLRGALRVRALHTAVARRAQALQAPAAGVVRLPPSDPLDDATMLI